MFVAFGVLFGSCIIFGALMKPVSLIREVDGIMDENDTDKARNIDEQHQFEDEVLTEHEVDLLEPDSNAGTWNA